LEHKLELPAMLTRRGVRQASWLEGDRLTLIAVPHGSVLSCQVQRRSTRDEERPRSQIVCTLPVPRQACTSVGLLEAIAHG